LQFPVALSAYGPSAIESLITSLRSVDADSYYQWSEGGELTELIKSLQHLHTALCHKGSGRRWYINQQGQLTWGDHV
jgi:hypothetical protein